MKWHSLILTLMLGTGAVIAHPPAGIAQSARENEEARKLWKDGNDLYNQRNFAEAEKKFRDALMKYPKADQSDRNAYYLIITLEKLRRLQDLRTEIENFHRNYSGSPWREDVDEVNVRLGGLQSNDLHDLLQQEAKIQKERAEAERRGSTAFPQNASRDAQTLRRIIQMDLNAGIERLRERLKADPSDPAVDANLTTIFNSNPSQGVPFLLEVWANPAVSPNVRNNAFFFAMRRTPDKVQVANTFMEMLGKKENEPIVSEALFRMTYIEHRAVLEKIAGSSNPGKFDAMEKIFRGGSITLRCDLLTAVSRLKDDSRAETFIMDAAQNDIDPAVRNCATDSLKTLKSVNTDNFPGRSPRVVAPTIAAPWIPVPPPPLPQPPAK